MDKHRTRESPEPGSNLYLVSPRRRRSASPWRTKSPSEAPDTPRRNRYPSTEFAIPPLEVPDDTPPPKSRGRPSQGPRRPRDERRLKAADSNSSFATIARRGPSHVSPSRVESPCAGPSRAESSYASLSSDPSRVAASGPFPAHERTAMQPRALLPMAFSEASTSGTSAATKVRDPRPDQPRKASSHKSSSKAKQPAISPSSPT